MPVTVSFGVATYRVAERDDQVVTVRLSADAERMVTIPILKSEVDANSADYSGVPSSVVFNSGDLEQTLTVTTVNDTGDDDDERINLTFGTLPTAVTAGSPSETSIHSTDEDDPTVTVSFKESSYMVAEGAQVTVTVTLSASPERTVAIPIEFTSADAALGNYGLPASVTFNAGQTTQSINFTATDDDVDDDDGHVIVPFDASALDNVSAGNQTTVWIKDDDQRGVSVFPDALTVAEGRSGEYTVVLNSQATGDVTVEITVPASSDISVDPTELTFTTSDWDQPKTVMFTAASDELDAEDDTGSINHAASGGDYGPTQRRSPLHYSR